MGIKRAIKRATGIGAVIDTVKNIHDEGSISQGLKRTIKESVCEDNPITKWIYEEGKYDGKRNGYEEASNAYEMKFFAQADVFLAQKMVYENQRDEYEDLLDEYEKEISVLTNMPGKSVSEVEYLQQLINANSELRKLLVCKDKTGNNSYFVLDDVLYGVEREVQLENYVIDKTISIKANESSSIENKRVFVKENISCDGSLSLKNCEVIFYGNRHIYLLGEAVLKLENCSISKRVGGKRGRNIDGRGIVVISNCLFTGCIELIRAQSVEMHSCYIKNCYRDFLSAKSYKAKNCVHENSFVSSEIQSYTNRNPQTGAIIEAKDPPYYSVDEFLHLDSFEFNSQIAEDIDGIIEISADTKKWCRNTECDDKHELVKRSKIRYSKKIF